jgi:hypothetical protein
MKFVFVYSRQIGSSTKRWCCTSEYQHSCRTCECIELSLSQCVQRCDIDSVASLWTIDCDNRYLVAPFERNSDVFIHSCALYHGFEAMTSTPQTPDPVRQRRSLIAVWTKRANRFGYLAFGVSIVAVAVGLIDTFTPLIGRLATAGLVIGSILLAPAIVLGYAIKSAEKEDRLNGV